MPDGSLPVEVARLRRELAQVRKGQRIAHGASIENSTLEVRDDSNRLRTILGLQGDGTVGMQAVNGPPPPTPSAPVVASVIGGVTASWDGAFEGGAIIPMDWNRVEVHASTSPDFIPDPVSLQSTIETAQGGTVVVPCQNPVYVRLLARNTSGTASLPSAVVGPFGPKAVVATEILDGIVTTVKLADDAVTAAKVAAGAIDSRAIADAAVGAQKIGDAAVTTGKLAAGAVNMNALTAALADTASQRWVDAMADPTAWAITSTGTGAAWTYLTGVTDAPTGQTVGQAVGYIRLRGTTLIPYDPDVLYRVSARVRATVQPTTADVFYVGVLGIGADGVTLVNRTGDNSANSHTYCAASGKSLPSSDGWVTVVGYLKGRAASGSAGPNADPRSPGVLHTNVKFITPYVWLNYNSQSAPNGTMQVDAVTVEALKTGVVDSTNLVAGSVTTAALATDSVTAIKIAATAVTTAKLDAGAVTTAKLAAGAVTANEIAANAVTAGKILAGEVQAVHLAAGSVQTAALAADSVAAGKIAANAVTAREIAALAVTADKIDANAITASKIAAGAVDATALSATAITGKTITGGSITGSVVQTATSGERITLNELGQNKVIVYNASGTAIGEFSARGTRMLGTSGALLIIDPNTRYPQMSLYNSTNTNRAIVQVVETAAGDSNLETMGGQFTGNGYSDMRWHTVLGNDWAAIERFRADDPSHTTIGGWLYLNATRASIGFVNQDDTSKNSVFYVYSGYAQLNGGRLEVIPPASTQSALYVNAATGHTGNLVRVLVNGAERFNVDKDGNGTFAGGITSKGRPVPVPGAWTSLTASAWTTTPSNTAYQSIRICSDGNRAYLDGAASTLTAYSSGSQNAFTVPTGMRPTKNHYYSVVRATSGSPTFLGCVVQSSGVITIYTSSAVATGDTFDFSAISWPLD
ncbi:hypothetical protein ACFC08_28355 [Streptomyces sp. NPDC056112]|uniref:hypothetical protein n=1 Tax=Streptomyces sp. NPDC056112 TaxID=3345715 RepID=UPI0035E24A66